MENTTYKQFHEEYMQNLNGSTLIDTAFIGLVEPFTVFIARTTFLGLQADHSYSSSPASLATAVYTFLVEFLIMVLPLTLCFTVLSNYSHAIFIVTVGGCFALLFASYLKARCNSSHFVQNFTLLEIADKRAFITNFRATVNLMTAICILAVDFKIFPRRYAKTENYGYSLMDNGVGLYCMANAIITPEARNQQKSTTGNYLYKIFAAFTSSIPLILLGAARFFTTQQIDYQQHISEYGVHWNFFITLAAVKIICTIILTIVKARYAGLVGIILILIHQTILGCGVQDWVLSHAERVDFLSANREGIVSSLGYVSIFFMGIAIGQIIQRPRVTMRSNLILELYLVGIALTLWSLNYWTDYYFQVSRRLANIGYCAWILAYSVTLIAIYLLIEIMILAYISWTDPPRKRKSTVQSVKLIPVMLNAISFNGLFFFLLANLFTGLINICIQTLRTNDWVSLLIINCYMFVVCFVTLFLYRMEIKLKIW